MSQNKITDKEMMQGKMIADSMLDGLLSSLHDVKKTNHGVQAMTHTMTMFPAIANKVSSFMSKMKEDLAYLSQCSDFQKRILLYVVVECVMVGEDINFKFSSENLTPLETVLVRLSDIALAFENEIPHDEFLEIWIQTMKQTIIMFLKNDQPVEASKILVLYRDRIIKTHKDMLENLIKICSKRKNYIHKLSEEDGHDYISYYYAIADFLQDLNSRLKGTTLNNFAHRINNSVMEDSTSGDEDANASGSEADTVTNERDIDEPHEGSSRKENNSQHEKKTSVPQNGLKNSNSVEIEEFSSSSDFESEHEQIAKTKPLIEIQDSDDVESDQQSNKTATTTTTSKSNDGKLDPKIGLAYRLKKQAYSSGIIIPCKHIVTHCQKVNNEMDEISDATSHISLKRKPTKTSAPLTAANLLKSQYKPRVPTRNLLLGERFEDVNTTLQSTSGRSYSSRSKSFFTLELDSYIVTGCRYFGVGQWSKILKAFPFPPECTNVKIKDRFRTLIKLKYVAILDDKDFNVLNNELKSKIPSAETKMKTDIKRAEKRPDLGDGGSSVQSSSATRPSATTIRSNPTTEKSTFSRNRDKNANSRRKQKPIVTPNELQVEPTDSSENEEPRRRVPALIKFSSREDAYLLCGARHLGMRWNLLKDYFDFDPEKSTIDMQNRWDALIESGQIYVNDDDDEIVCNDDRLQIRCENVTGELRERIQNQRKKFSAAAGNDTPASESGESSGVVRSHTLQQKIQDTSDESDKNVSEEEVGEEPQFEQPCSSSTPIKVKPRPKKGLVLLNTSTDAGTQTKRAKFTLGKSSPSVLEANSSSSSASSVESEPKPEKRKKPLSVGSPIRPSMINLFKQNHKTKASRSETSLKRKRDRRDSFAIDIRERRQREISRMQRQKTGGKKNPWRDSEIKQLLAGLAKHGPSKWALILDEGYEVFNNRTSVMLKDKFRNMLKHNLIPEDLVLLGNARKAAKE